MNGPKIVTLVFSLFMSKSMRKVLGDIQNWWQLYVLEHQRQYEAILSHFCGLDLVYFWPSKLDQKMRTTLNLKCLLRCQNECSKNCNALFSLYLCLSQWEKCLVTSKTDGNCMILEHQRQYEAILSHFCGLDLVSFLTIKIGSKNEDNAQLKMPAALSKSMVQKL